MDDCKRVAAPIVTAISFDDREWMDALNRLQQVNLEKWLRTYVRTHAPGSIDALKKDWKHFAKFCATLSQNPTRATGPVLCAYVRSMEALAPTTIRRRARACIALFRAIQRADINDLDAEVKEETQAMIREKARRGENIIGQAKPMRWSLIKKGIEALDLSDLKNLRDAAMVRLAYDAMLRRSELVEIRLKHLKSINGGELGTEDAYLLLPYSKTDQEGEGEIAFCRHETALLIMRWAREAPIKPDDYLFSSFEGRSRRINKGFPMNPESVNLIFRRFAESAGICSIGISGHSCRVGAAQDQIAAGATTAQTTIAGRWRSDAMPIRYTRHLQLMSGSMAMLAELQRQESAKDRCLDE